VRRGFWVAVGLGAGATAAYLSARWARRQRQRLAPANLGRQASETMKDLRALVGESAREFRAGMAEKENEIRGSLPD
jgi:hypothetical protein